MINQREYVTYSDCVHVEDSRIYIIYDHERYPRGEVLMSTFSEEDVHTGEPVSDKTQCNWQRWFFTFYVV